MFMNNKTGQRRPQMPVNTNVQTPEEAKAQWETEGWVFPPGSTYDESAKAWVVASVKEPEVEADDKQG